MWKYLLYKENVYTEVNCRPNKKQSAYLTLILSSESPTFFIILLFYVPYYEIYLSNVECIKKYSTLGGC